MTISNAARALGALLVLGGCMADETLTGYGASGTTWALQSMNGAPFPAQATIRFPQEGRIEGQGPCNRYFARQAAPYPWVRIEAIGATKMACPALNDETAFFQALEAMTLAEVAGDTLILSNEQKDELVFNAAP